jgi:hypothetical protein
MLALAGHNPMGNVLHVIVGPETEFFVDIHGAKILDITDLLGIMDHDDRVYLSLTRCKSEPQTEAALKHAKAPYVNSFFISDGCGDPDCPNCSTDPKKKEKNNKSKPKQKLQKCNYCHQAKPLLPIAGFKICVQCAQIELGLKQIRKDDEEQKDA